MYLTPNESEQCRTIAQYRMTFDTMVNGKKLRLRKASMGAKAGRLLCRRIKELGVNRILEIGTCAGIGAAYMCLGAEANGPVHFTGMEGRPEVLDIALKTLKKFTKNTEYYIVAGMFQDTLPRALAFATPLQFVYLDGWHKKDPTIAMFNQCVEAMPEGGYIAVDDLQQNKNGMRAAGVAIRKHPRATDREAFAGKELFRILPE